MAMATQATYGAPAAKKMKLEHDGSTPGTPQPLTSTPATTYTTTAQWSTRTQLRQFFIFEWSIKSREK